MKIIKSLFLLLFLLNQSIFAIVNINTASKEELKTLHGIGNKLADKIIEYRKTNKFSKIEDIRGIRGIGEKRFTNIKTDISIGSYELAKK